MDVFLPRVHVFNPNFNGPSQFGFGNQIYKVARYWSLLSTSNLPGMDVGKAMFQVSH